MKAVRVSWWVLMTVCMVVVVVGLVGCGAKPVDPCQVHPTRTNALGECVEYDSEVCDEDPCDADDLNEVDHRKPSPAATKPKTSTTRRR